MFSSSSVRPLLFLLLFSIAGVASADNWMAVAEAVIEQVDASEQAYRAGDVRGARQTVVGAYFGVFEERKMEAAMRMQLGAKHTYQVERLFGALRKAVKQPDAGGRVAEVASQIRQAMRRDAALLDEAGIPLTVYRVNQ